MLPSSSPPAAADASVDRAAAAASFGNPEALALSALRFRARQASATFLARSIDDALVVGAGEVEEEVFEEDAGTVKGVATTAAAATTATATITAAALAPSPVNPATFSWADAARDALASDVRRRQRDASGASKTATRAVGARFSSVGRGGGRGGGGRGRGRGRGRVGVGAAAAGAVGAAAPASKPAAVAAFLPAPAAAAAAEATPFTALPRVFPLRTSSPKTAAVALPTTAPALLRPLPPPPPPPPPSRSRKRTRREAEDADERYRAAVAAANASVAAAAVVGGGGGGAAGGAFLSFPPSALGFPFTMSPPRQSTAAAPAFAAAPERFVHPERWPAKSGSVRARGAARLAPVSEVATPRRLRPAPWGVFFPARQSDEDGDEKETSPEANSCSVLRVASPSSSASASSSLAPSSTSPSSSSSSSTSCFPRTAVRRSRIAGLGLYALARVSRGSAVAEYSGELVRATLADLREVDYARLGLGVYFFGIGSVGGSGGGGGGGEDDEEFAGSRIPSSSSSSPSSRGGGPPLVIDATMKGGRARFVNHSCAPNCFAELVVGGGGGEREQGDAGSGGSKGGENAAASPSSPSPSPSCRPRVLIRAAVDLMPGEEITYDYCLSGEPEAGAGGGGGGGSGAAAAAGGGAAAAAGRSHDLHNAAGVAVVRCACGAPMCRGVL